MPLDGLFADTNAPLLRKSLRGRGNYHAGLSAETLVQRHYQALGFTLAAARWRGGGGEIDLIFDGAGGDWPSQIFVEVKSSASFDQAAGLIGMAQIRRLFAAADAYVEARHGHQNIERRFDLALVDRFARLSVQENALMLW